MSIFKKQDKHILINYIYDYDKLHLFHYTSKVINEINKRGFKIRSYNNYYLYFKPYFNIENYAEYRYINSYKYSFREHNNEYLTICYYNLKEKYLRGQKDFTKEVWDKLDRFYKEKIND